ncbi:MAG: hypothetical protein R6U61_01700 [Thermoplasmata archaeon]
MNPKLVQQVDRKLDYLVMDGIFQKNLCIFLISMENQWISSRTDGRSHDSPVFEQLIKYLPQLEKVTGDGAHSSRENFQIVDDKNGKPF